jgi:hypothetical protein
MWWKTSRVMEPFTVVEYALAFALVAMGTASIVAAVAANRR